jgi:hypothetical protein
VIGSPLQALSNFMLGHDFTGCSSEIFVAEQNVERTSQEQIAARLLIIARATRSKGIELGQHQRFPL